jgi:phosphate transport system substrate-binding protein
MAKKLIALTVVVIIAVIIVLSYYILYYHSKSSTQDLGSSKSITKTLEITLQGAGATFVYPQIAEWIKLFSSSHGIQVNYQSVGSGAGLSMFFQNTTDFACSDPPLSKDTWEKHRGNVLQVPWLAGAVVVVYNIPELPKNINLKLDGVALAKIYKGEIVYWSDPYIKSLNPDLMDRLPDKEIIPVYRTDSSGTTELFTTFLYKSSNGIWPKELVGKTVNWPITGRGIGGKGNEGVTQATIQTSYSIGYVEWSYAIANNLSIAMIKNAEGLFVQPSERSIMSALENVRLPPSPLDDFSNIIYEVIYASGSESYPIAAVTHIVLWRRYDGLKALALKEFLTWIANEGYEHIVPGYIAPPQSFRKLLIEAANTITS